MFDDEATELQKKIATTQSDMYYAEQELKTCNEVYLELVARLNILKESVNTLTHSEQHMRGEAKVVSIKEYRDILIELQYSTNATTTCLKELKNRRHRINELTEAIEGCKIQLKLLQKKADAKGNILKYEFRRAKTPNK